MAASDLPKMKLWYHPKLRSTRCIWLVKELGIEDKIEFKYVPIGPPPPDPERKLYRQTVHPHGTVPALEIEGRPPIIESGAICMYLADLCGCLAPELKDRADYYNSIVYCTGTLDVAQSRLARQWMFTPKDKQDPEVISSAKAVADLCLHNLNKMLEGKKYIAGDELTAADCVLGYNIVWASVLNEGILLKDHHNLQTYLGTIMARAALQEALAYGK